MPGHFSVGGSSQHMRSTGSAWGVTKHSKLCMHERLISVRTHNKVVQRCTAHSQNKHAEESVESQTIAGDLLKHPSIRMSRRAALVSVTGAAIAGAFSLNSISASKAADASEIMSAQTSSATSTSALSNGGLSASTSSSVTSVTGLVSGPTAEAASARIVDLIESVGGEGISSELVTRFNAAGSISSPGNSIFSKPGLVYFPRWMFGEWDITSTFAKFQAPLGQQYVDQALWTAAQAPVEQGGVGFSTGFKCRWFSTLPDTMDNNLKVWLGMLPNDAIISDRAFNLVETTNAALGFEAVANVTYDPRTAPDRETVEFSRLGPDMRPLPPRKTEVYINNTRYEQPDANTFIVTELFRQVAVGVRSVDVNDFEVMTLYKQIAPGRVQAVQRTAVYLEPRDKLYFQARNRAVAVYDYLLDMTRQRPPQEAADRGAVACVMTPKDVTQCI